MGSAERWSGLVGVVGTWAVLEVLSQQSVRVPQAHSPDRGDAAAAFASFGIAASGVWPLRSAADGVFMLGLSFV